VFGLTVTKSGLPLMSEMARIVWLVAPSMTDRSPPF